MGMCIVASFVIPLLFTLTAPPKDAPPPLTVNPPVIVCATEKLLFCPLYATLVRVPVVLISAPPTWRAVLPLIVATDNVPEDPLSVKVRSVFGDPSASLTVRVPLFPAVERVTVGVVLDRVSGEAPLKATFPEALIVVTFARAPVFVIPALPLLIPPATVKPPVVILVAPPIV